MNIEHFDVLIIGAGLSVTERGHSCPHQRLAAKMYQNEMLITEVSRRRF